MTEIRQTDDFSEWFQRLRDRRAKARIFVRIDRLQFGLAGDIRSVGDGVSEVRIDYGPGYRIYLTKRGSELIILLAGGDKSSQNRDIRRAKKLAKGL